MKYIGKSILAVVVSATVLVLIAIVQTGGPVAAITSGMYTYDPRRDQPSHLIVENRPEMVLLATLQQQIAQDGTYPPDAALRIVALEPTKVELQIGTDWHAIAYVTMLLRYDNGIEQHEIFEFQSLDSEGFDLPLLPDIALHNTFRPLTACRKITLDKSYCPVG
ncbi:MAG: hypothetical protein JOZ51_01060 [Chloroflexi bacterium]|nr:hypothetical protein [Chloroflexota bacterium]